MSIKAGRLRHRITIQERVLTQDSDLNAVYDWRDVASVWAAIEPLSAREFLAAQAAQSQVQARITIRYRDGMNAQMRIKHGAKLYNPVGFLADPDSGLEYLTIPVSVGTGDGG